MNLLALQTRTDFLQLMMNAHKEPDEEKPEDKQEDKEHEREFEKLYKGTTKRSITN